MTRIERLLSNGTWIEFTGDLARLLAKALDMEQHIARNLDKPVPADTHELMARLERGGKVHYGTDWHEQVRGVVIDEPVAEATETADCGHTVRAGAVMNASLGTACPDCYDAMSDGAGTHRKERAAAGEYACDAGHTVRTPLRPITLPSGVELEVCQDCYAGEIAYQQTVKY